jgi:hypothetical protein
MPVTKTEIFEVRSDLIKWIEDKPAKVRRQAKLVIINLAVASREPDPAQASVAILLADQVGAAPGASGGHPLVAPPLRRSANLWQKGSDCCREER